ncbi:MAG: signal peptidase I [Mycobacteriaceae bacterium]
MMTTPEITPAPATQGRSRSFTRELILSVGAIAGVICVISAIAALAFDVKPLIFRSGSMSPTISTGSLALAKSVPASDLSLGDVVSVEDSLGTRITHRISSIGNTQGNTTALILKGDANNTADAEPYFVSEADRVFFSAPKLGYVASWLNTPIALFTGGLLCAFAIFTIIRPGDVSRSSRSRHSKGGRGAPVLVKAAPVTLAIAVTIALGGSQIQGTKAAFTDTASGVSNFSASNAFVTLPPSFTCTTSGFLGIFTSVDLSWPHVGPGYSYRLVYRSGTATPVTTTVTTTVATGATVNFANTASLITPGFFGSAVTVELYSVINGLVSTSFLSYNLVGWGFSWYYCGTPGPGGTATAAPLQARTLATPDTASTSSTTTVPPTTLPSSTTTVPPTTVPPTTLPSSTTKAATSTTTTGTP